MESNNNISLLELDGDYIIRFDNKITFSLNNKKSFVEYDMNNTYKLIDPVFDEIFKTIFAYGHESNKISGKERLISFLNSILHSKYREKIVSIEYFPNDL